MVSVAFPSAPYLPSAAFTCCTWVLSLSLPQRVSYVALAVAFLVPSKLLASEKLLDRTLKEHIDHPGWHLLTLILPVTTYKIQKIHGVRKKIV